MLLIAIFLSFQANLDLAIGEIQAMTEVRVREMLMQEAPNFLADRSELKLQKDGPFRYVPKVKRDLAPLELLVERGPSSFRDLSHMIKMRKPLRSNLFRDSIEVVVKQEPDAYSIVPQMAYSFDLGPVHPLELRDIAFFGLGQVVNRRFGHLSDSQGIDFVSFQPKSIAIATAWLAKPEVAVKRSLILDVLRPDCEFAKKVEGLPRH